MNKSIYGILLAGLVGLAKNSRGNMGSTAISFDDLLLKKWGSEDLSFKIEFNPSEVSQFFDIDEIAIAMEEISSVMPVLKSKYSEIRDETYDQISPEDEDEDDWTGEDTDYHDSLIHDEFIVVLEDEYQDLEEEYLNSISSAMVDVLASLNAEDLPRTYPGSETFRVLNNYTLIVSIKLPILRTEMEPWETTFLKVDYLKRIISDLLEFVYFMKYDGTLNRQRNAYTVTGSMPDNLKLFSLGKIDNRNTIRNF
jgi:hypothetical protein